MISMMACLENAYANYLRSVREYDSAIVHYNKLKTLISENTQLYHKTLAEDAFVYYRKNDYQSAINNLLEAYKSDADYIKIQAVNGLADCYKMIGDTVRVDHSFRNPMFLPQILWIYIL